jgi:hypothetical protein
LSAPKRRVEMTQQALLGIETATTVSQWPRDLSSEPREKEEPGDIEAILIDAAIHVGSLIDAVCCRIGEWVDWQHYHPHPRLSDGGRGDQDTIVHLKLMEDERSLRGGGYIEIHVMPQEEVIETDGGYYDAYNQPRPVIDGAFRWHEVDTQRLGQVLLVMHNRIMREYMMHECSEGSPEVPSPSLGRGIVAESLRGE